MNITIRIDGPQASGKSTIADAITEFLQMRGMIIYSANNGHDLTVQTTPESLQRLRDLTVPIEIHLS